MAKMSSENLLHKSHRSSASEPAINWRSVVCFVARSWKFIVAGGLIGAVLVATYVLLVPPRYEASATMRMAQVPVQMSTGTYARQNVEPPTLLMERLRSPSLYTGPIVSTCGVDPEPSPGEELVERLRLTVPPAQADYVLSVAYRAASVNQAAACTNALIDMARRLQAEESKPVISDLGKQLQSLRSRLADNRAYLVSMEKTAGYQSAFLAQRDELNFLSRRIEDIEGALALVTQTRLIAPVYASPEPVFPRRRVPLIVLGALCGCLVGLMLAGAREAR